MKIKKILLITISIILLSICSCHLLLNLSIGHPVNQLESLMITEKDLPKGWKLDYIKPITGDFNWGTENRSEVFVLEPERGSILQYIYRFDNKYDAMYAHFFLKRSLPLNKQNEYSFLTYQSTVANNWFFACKRNRLNGPRCEAFSRYEDYIVYLSVSTDQEALTAEELQKILQGIDDRMKVFLEK